MYPGTWYSNRSFALVQLSLLVPGNVRFQGCILRSLDQDAMWVSFRSDCSAHSSEHAGLSCDTWLLDCAFCLHSYFPLFRELRTLHSELQIARETNEVLKRAMGEQVRRG